jgi:hypothetical protein
MLGKFIAGDFIAIAGEMRRFPAYRRISPAIAIKSPAMNFPSMG